MKRILNRAPGSLRDARLVAQRGFTLIEVMVALMIFALLTGVAYRGLDAVLNANARVEQETDKWSTLALAFLNVQQALAAAVDRPIRDRDGGIGAAFIGLASVRNEDEAPLVFTRMGFPGHRGVLADLQRVGYRLRGDRFEQLIWPALDHAPGSAPQAVELAAGVAGFSARYFAIGGAVQTSWPVAGDAATLPAAVEVTLRLATGEEITRLFSLL